MLLVFSDSDQQGLKQLHSREKPRSGTSQTRPHFIQAAEGASGVQSDTAQAAVARRGSFIDDGMFDPRRDYWGNVGRMAGADSTATTPASSNWAAGEMRCLF